MSNWRKFKLDQFAEILDHLRIPVNEEERSRNPGTTPYYGANGLQGYINGWIFDEPLILIAEDGGYFDEYAARPIAYKITDKSWVNNHAHVLRPKGSFDFDYIFYCLQHKNLIPLIKGGTRSKLNQKELREIEIYAPEDEPLQTAISKIIATTDRAIAHTEALIEKYQQIKAGLMHDLFTRGIGADGKLRPPRDEAPELYQESAIGWIPKDWIITKADSLITGIDAGKSPECPDQPASADQWGVLKVSAVHPDGLKQTENKVVSKLQYQIPGLLVKEGDLLITRANTPELVGMICHVNQVDRKLILSDKTLRLRVDGNRIDKRFLYWVFQHPRTRNQIEIDATGSSGSMKNISQRNIRNLDIAIPNSLGEQEMIRMRLDNIFNKVKKDTFTKNKLEKQKSGLMHDLLTGKVPVKVDPDEVDHISN